MQLETYLRQERLTPAEFAPRVGASQSAVKKWLRRERLPRPAMLAKIEAETGGAVRPNDFFDGPVQGSTTQDVAAAR